MYRKNNYGEYFNKLMDCVHTELSVLGVDYDKVAPCIDEESAVYNIASAIDLCVREFFR